MKKCKFEALLPARRTPAGAAAPPTTGMTPRPRPSGTARWTGTTRGGRAPLGAGTAQCPGGSPAHLHHSGTQLLTGTPHIGMKLLQTGIHHLNFPVNFPRMITELGVQAGKVLEMETIPTMTTPLGLAPTYPRPRRI